MSKGCTCSDCIKACKVKPGSFTPSELKRLSKGMRMPLPELFAKYLAADIGRGVTTVSPATDKTKPGSIGTVSGRCVFLTEDERCAIHDIAKPLECRLADHHGRHYDTEQFLGLWRRIDINRLLAASKTS